MQIDVVRLRDFYASPLGVVTARLVSARLGELWPDVAGRRVLGLGYAVPYLGALVPDGVVSRRQAERVIALMPSHQGVHPWPVISRRGNLAALANETALPLADGAIDLILMVHYLETSESLKPMLREAWRVLADGGRLLVIAPNRTGSWAFFERTPFGYGRPYSVGQLEAVLRTHLFTPTRRSTSLFAPPMTSSAGLRALMAAESVGGRWWRRLGGVVLMEAEKRLYALNATVEPARARRLAPTPAVPTMNRNHKEPRP